MWKIGTDLLLVKDHLEWNIKNWKISLLTRHYFFSDSMVLNLILHLTADFCLCFAFCHVEKTPVKWKKGLATLTPQIAVAFKWIFSTWNNVECLLFLGNNTWICENLIFYFGWVILFCKYRSLWSLPWLITARCSCVSQLCEKKGCPSLWRQIFQSCPGEFQPIL